MKRRVFVTFLFVFLIGLVTSQNCSDSDGGVNLYVKGFINISNGYSSVYTDRCTSSILVLEYTCNPDGSGSGGTYNCVYGCSDGVCNTAPVNETPTCSHDCTSLGLSQCFGNYTKICGNYDSDSCLEWDSGTYCSYGCSNGICLFPNNETHKECIGSICVSVNGTGVDQCVSNSQCVTVVNETHKECIGSICVSVNGTGFDECTNNSQCIVFVNESYCGDGVCNNNESVETCPVDCSEVECTLYGLRKLGKYCDENLKFSDQKDEDEVCENNFECKSNLCLGNECVSVGLLKRILNWFKDLFGLSKP